jgi:hypothetical protein
MSARTGWPVASTAGLCHDLTFGIHYPLPRLSTWDSASARSDRARAG